MDQDEVSCPHWTQARSRESLRSNAGSNRRVRGGSHTSVFPSVFDLPCSSASPTRTSSTRTCGMRGSDVAKNARHFLRVPSPRSRSPCRTDKIQQVQDGVCRSTIRKSYLLDEISDTTRASIQGRAHVEECRGSSRSSSTVQTMSSRSVCGGPAQDAGGLSAPTTRPSGNALPSASAESSRRNLDVPKVLPLGSWSAIATDDDASWPAITFNATRDSVMGSSGHSSDCRRGSSKQDILQSRDIVPESRRSPDVDRKSKRDCPVDQSGGGLLQPSYSEESEGPRCRDPRSSSDSDSRRRGQVELRDAQRPPAPASLPSPPSCRRTREGQSLPEHRGGGCATDSGDGPAGHVKQVAHPTNHQVPLPSFQEGSSQRLRSVRQSLPSLPSVSSVEVVRLDTSNKQATVVAETSGRRDSVLGGSRVVAGSKLLQDEKTLAGGSLRSLGSDLSEHHQDEQQVADDLRVRSSGHREQSPSPSEDSPSSPPEVHNPCRRPHCRFTALGDVAFMGFSTSASLQDFTVDRILVLNDYEHASVSLLKERCARMQHDTHPRVRCRQLDLLLDLSASYGLHYQALLESGKDTAIDGVPALLALGLHVVETLDVVVAPEDFQAREAQIGKQTRIDGVEDIPNTILCSGGCAATSLDILNGNLRGVLSRVVGGQALAQELELQAALIVRLVLTWDSSTSAPHLANTLLDVNGQKVLLNFVLTSLHSIKSTPVQSRRHQDLAVLALVLDGLCVCLRKTKTLRVSSRRWSRSVDSKAGDSQQNEAIAPLVPVALDVLEIVEDAVCAAPGEEWRPRDAEAAAIFSSAVAAAIDVLSVVGTAGRRDVEFVDWVPFVARALARLLEEQPPSVRLLLALRRMVTKPIDSTWITSYVGSQPNQRLCQALVQQEVLRLCIAGLEKSLAAESPVVIQESFTDKGSLTNAFSFATSSAVRMFTMFEHLEAIVYEVSGVDAEGPATLHEVRALRGRCVGDRAEDLARSESQRGALLQNLSHLRDAIRQSCMAPKWRF